MAIIKNASNAISLFANIGQIFSTHWAVIISSIITFFATTGAWINQLGAQWGYLPIFLVALIVFTSTIWLINGIIWMKNQNKPSQNLLSFDYSYGLAFEGINFLSNPKSLENSLQFFMVLRNATNHPIKFYVEDFRIILGSNTILNPIFVLKEGIIPVGSSRHFLYPSFPANTFINADKPLEGKLETTIKYGHPELGYFRLLKRELDITFSPQDNALSQLTVIEEEIEIKP